nr:MAG TPA: tail protein [Caudoviricetes sp.]
MAYPILYKANETNFEHLGVSVLSDASKCYVSRERNGIYILEFDYPVNGKDVDKIKEGMYIKVDAGYRTKNQRFIVSKITKTQNDFKIYCQHVSQVKTTMNAIRPDITLTSASAVGALTVWRDNLLDSREEFFVQSDISTLNSTTWKVENIENARDALGGKAGSILDVWGGEYEFDNLNITLHKSMGIDNPTIIAYGKNLLDLEQEQSILETYTSVFPFKKYTDDNNREQLITLPEILLDSTHLNKFTHRRILKVDFSSDENLKTVEQLRSKAKSYIKSNNVGVPKTNLKINYQDLSKVEGIFDNPALEQIDLCDRLKVYYNELGILNENAKVVKVIWDVILEENHEIEVGDSRSSFTDSTSAKLESLQAQNDSVIARINALVAEQEAAYDRFFKEKSKVIEDKVKDAYEKALLSSEEKLRKMGEAFDEKLAPIRDQVSTTVENYNRQFQATNLEISKNRVEATKQIQALSDRVNNIQDISNNETVRELRGLVNGATSKVTELENSITREFTDVKKKNEDSLNAVKAEFTKGVDGLTSKISSLEEYKNQDESRTENLKQWVQRDTASQLSQERTEIIRNVRDSIPTNIGGRNYIPDSDKLINIDGEGKNWEKTVENGTLVFTKVRATESDGIRIQLMPFLKDNFQNEVLTWSIDVKASKNISFDLVGQQTNGFKGRVDITTDWQRISHTFTNRYNQRYNFGFYKMIGTCSPGDKIYIRLPKLEKGNVATDWTPAPEDNNAFVKNTEFSSKFTESARGITNQLAALENYKNQDGTRVANLQIWVQNNTANQLTAERRNIEKWVNDKGYATTSVVENKVRETANSFSREISNVRNSIPTSLGGRNYVIDSKNLKAKPHWGSNKWDESVDGDTIILTKKDGSDKTGFWFNLTDLVKTQFQNETLTWSIEIKASRNITLNSVGFESNGQTKVDVTTNWKRYSYTFVNRFTNYYMFTFNNPTTNFNNGDKIYIKLPKLETGNVATDWTPAPEDVEQNVNELNTWKQTATETLNTVSSGLNDTVKHSQLRIGANGINFGSNQVFDGRNLSSMLSVSPESIQAITDKLIITPANENLANVNLRGDVTFKTRDLYLNRISDNNKAGDEYYFNVEAEQVLVSSNTYKDLKAMVHVAYKNNTHNWFTEILYPASGYGVKNCTATVKIPDENKEIDFIDLIIHQTAWNDYTTYNLKKINVVKKKSAELIVDGSIEGRQIKTQTLETGHHKAGSITSEIIAANAVRAKHILIDDGLINNLVTHNAFISKLWAQDAFIRSLKTVKISTTQLDTDWLSAYTGDIGGFRIGKNPNQPGDFWLTGSNNFNCGLNPGHNIGTRGAQIWAAWGYNWNQAGPNAWWVDGQGRMNCKGSATFYGGLHVFNARLDTHGQDIQGDANSAGAKTTVIWWSQINRVKSSVSDKRFKTNIKPTKVKAVDLLNKIEMVEFNWKKDNKFEKIGAIAQQVQSVEESLVVKDMDSKQSHSDYLRISYYDAIPYLIKAVQELSEENNKLKNKLEEITNG